MKDRTMILGAAGFIGTNLTLRLLDAGKQLVLFDRKGVVYASKVMDAVRSGQACVREDSFSEMWNDEKKNRWLESVPELRNTDTVYHLVSTTCPSNTNRDAAAEIRDNLLSTIYLLDACVEAEVQKVVFLSSGGTVYGKEHTGICREEEEAFPITVYGVQKLGIEKMLYLYSHMYGLDYRIVRLSNPYGPYQRPDGVQGVVTTFAWRALQGLPIEVYGDGSVVRDYIYIDDAVDGILRIAEGEGRYRLYNLGSGKGHSVLDVIHAIENSVGKKLQITYQKGRSVDVPVNVLDTTRFAEDFGSLKPIALQEGVERLVRFFKAEQNGNEGIDS